MSATDAAGASNVTPATTLWIGGRSREIVALLAHREFIGDWRPSADWRGAGSVAPAAGALDTARVNLTGGSYTIWVLGGGRGNGVSVSVDGTRGRSAGAGTGGRVAGGSPGAAGGGTAPVAPVSVGGDRRRSAPWSAPRYAAVLLSTDSTFTPPAGQVMDVVNSLALLSPDLAEPLAGQSS